ncbi:major capsid protein [Tortoise microvirus 88]|nr:major capsid protein [Tortoise microvirus 88]
MARSVTVRQLAQSVKPMGRVMRRPQHTFNIRHRPWQIQPFMIAPVLPGETMKNLLLQSRVVSDPVKHPLIGWWQEYYFFYVKHRDLEGRDDFTQMMLDPQHELSSLDTPANALTYHGLTGLDWTAMCLERVVAEYFRDEEDLASVFELGGLPLASISRSDFAQSLVTATEFAARQPEDAPADADASGVITASEIEGALQMWQFQRSNGLTKMDYEDFLATYGVNMPKEELHKPELIRYVRDWTYPANTVDPSTGTPSSALSWAVAESADKDRFFREPGFIFGVSVCRPKVYYSRQTSAAVSMMTDAFSWLPAVTSDDPWTSLKPFQAGEGPFSGATEGYWIDIKDLLLYGDQFINFVPAVGEAGFVALPTAGLQRKFASDADANALFTDVAKNLIRSDGIVSLGIAGQQVDTTPV